MTSPLIHYGSCVVLSGRRRSVENEGVAAGLLTCSFCGYLIKRHNAIPGLVQSIDHHERAFTKNLPWIISLLLNCNERLQGTLQGRQQKQHINNADLSHLPIQTTLPHLIHHFSCSLCSSSTRQIAAALHFGANMVDNTPSSNDL